MSKLIYITHDSVYNRSHIGGSALHHNLDANHTWHGAVDALRTAFPDKSMSELVPRAADHLLRDLTTPSGINPFLDPADFIATKRFMTESLHFPASLANDLLNVSAPELLGAAIATVAVLLRLDTSDVNRLKEHAGRLIASSIFVAGNPALLLVAAVCVRKVCYELWHGDSVVDVIEGAFASSLSATAFWLASALASGSVFVALAAGAAACYIVNRGYKRLTATVRYDLDVLLQHQFAGYRSYYSLFRYEKQPFG